MISDERGMQLYHSPLSFNANHLENIDHLFINPLNCDVFSSVLISEKRIRNVAISRNYAQFLTDMLLLKIHTISQI